MLSRPVCAALAASMFVSQAVNAFDHGVPRTEVLQVLQQTKFRIVRRISGVPVEPLVRAKFLPANRPLSSFLADPGKPFQSGTHAWMDDSRPMRQLIFAAISSDYVVLCFWHADWPADVRYMSVIRMDGAKAKEIFFCTLDGPAHTLGDVRQLLRRGGISVLGVS
jgi:hypothetical protein